MVIRRLWVYISCRRRKQLASLLVIMVIASVAEVLSIGSVLPFLGALMQADRVFEHPLAQWLSPVFKIEEASQIVFPLTLLFVAAALFSGAMRLILLWKQTDLGFAIGADLSIKIYRNTLYQPYSVHVARNSSQIISGISSKTNSVIYNTILPILSIVSGSLILVAILVTLIAIDPIVALVAFGGFGTIYAVVMMATKKRLGLDGLRINRESTLVVKALQEGLGGIRDVLIDGSQEMYCKIYRDADLPLRKSQANVQIIAGAPRFIVESFGMVLIAMLAYSIEAGKEGIGMAIPLLGALAIGAQRILPVLQQLYSNLTSIRSSRASLQEVVMLLEQPLPKYADASSSIRSAFNTSIRLREVSFRYAENAPMVLRNIDLEILKGYRIGFMGTTGSGKSTLVDMIMGLLEPTNGSLEVDETIISKENQRAWQAHIAHVPQSIFLADASIAENIAFGIPPRLIDHSMVRRAAKQAQIAHTIESWDKQYDTQVGERGVRLSGGQRQRIGIARALYKRADFIVFDEATSALDVETERLVMKSIEQLGEDITLLIVAHRLSTLENCDLIFELDHGRIKRVGTYQQLFVK